MSKDNVGTVDNVIQTLDALVTKFYAKEYANVIIQHSHISTIHEDTISACSKEISEYGLSFYVMSDDFHYYCENSSQLNVENILRDREELLDGLDAEDRLEMFSSVFRSVS